MSGFRLAGRKLGKLTGLLRADSPAAMYQLLVSAWPRPAELVLGGADIPGTLEEVLGNPALGTLLDRMMLSDQLTYLPDDQLAKIDRVSMAVSLEARVPLLDHRLVEFAWRLPQRMKVRGQDGKWLLRQSLYRRLPRAMVDREKVGFTVPLADWLRGPLRPWAESLLDVRSLGRSGLLNPQPIRAKWQAFCEGKTDDANPIWAVLMFSAWYDRWIEGTAA
jgi:asparagine synthase (glutamine-hydrolysing)